MKWVTWENVGIDRIGSAWLIRRSIDAKAQFLFVPRGQQPLPKGAEPFDIPGVRYSHHAGHCTFHTLVAEFKLDDPVLRRIARIIDEADTVQEVSLEPAAAGLDVICRGIRLTSSTDAQALTRGALVYDALYAQLAADAAEEAGGSQ
ncbi:MAG: chromate resistance protein [Planctomycetaceae bacterium]|nr:chromate resistance protein [Planctomycetaceae bacterium]